MYANREKFSTSKMNCNICKQSCNLLIAKFKEKRSDFQNKNIYSLNTNISKSPLAKVYNFIFIPFLTKH